MKLFQAKTLQEIYDYAEANTSEFYNCFQQFQFGRLAATFQKFAYENPKNKEATKAKWEELFFDLGILYDDFFSMDTVPAHLKIKAPQQAFLKERIQQAQHPFFISRYAHILHLCINTKEEKEKYGKIAIDAYLDFYDIFASYYQQNPIKKEEKPFLIELFDHLTINTFLLAVKLNYKIEKAKNNLLFTLRQERCLEWEILLRFALKHKKYFDQLDFIGFQKQCFKIGYRIMEPRDFQYSGVALDYFEKGKELAAFTGRNIYDWDKIIEEAKLYLANIIAHYDRIYEHIRKDEEKK